MNMLHTVETILDTYLKPGASIPKVMVDKLLETNGREALEKGHADERRELVCRLLAAGISAEEVSLIFKIRVEDIRDIERSNSAKIADYEKKLKARRKGREREAERRRQFENIARVSPHE